MSKFTDFIDGLKDEGNRLAKAELKELVASSTWSAGQSCWPTTI